MAESRPACNSGVHSSRELRPDELNNSYVDDELTGTIFIVGGPAQIAARRLVV
ncbi:hypothetical protein [Yoonia sp.]|uniref:hypothetical protein n=1 Tax=Yoonia sp. TaxID=2212373 RepID=UPI0019FA49D6|nr:hypothetical protein [Yoonia sp.]MBE0414720.1 hypothetical protein [Yoonia sp.]